MEGICEVVKAARDDPKALLRLCDELRDDVLPFAGIRLEDTGSGTVWKLARKEDLIAEREEKMRAAKEKEEMKKKMAEEKARKEKEKEEKAKIDPKVMFLGMTDLYSQFDEKVGEREQIECRECRRTTLPASR